MSPCSRVAGWSLAAGLLATTAMALGAGLAASTASAVEAPVRCGGQSLSSSTDKKCPTPAPSPSSGPQGSEVGCRNLIFGAGQFRGVGGAPSAGAALEFLTSYEAATCAAVTYTVVARDMDTFAELGTYVQQGNGATELLVSAMALPGYAKECIAVDVIVSEGAVVHDIGPNSRDLSQPPFADLCKQGASETVWN